jgi:hypothetical protein
VNNVIHFAHEEYRLTRRRKRLNTVGATFVKDTRDDEICAHQSPVALAFLPRQGR